MLSGLGLTNPWHGLGWSGTLGTGSDNDIGLRTCKTWGNGCSEPISFGCGGTMGNYCGSGSIGFHYALKVWVWMILLKLDLLE